MNKFKNSDKVMFDLYEFTFTELCQYNSDYTQFIYEKGVILNCYSYYSEVIFELNDIDLITLEIPNVMLKKCCKYEEIMYIKDGEWVKEKREIK